jgi:hypothetical protein
MDFEVKSRLSCFKNIKNFKNFRTKNYSHFNAFAFQELFELIISKEKFSNVCKNVKIKPFK